MAGSFGNTEALAVSLTPEGFGFRPPPTLPGFIEFGAATFRAGASEAERPRREAVLLGSLVYRPNVFRRNEIAWIAACAWRSAAKADDLAALKRAKREIDPQLIGDASELTATLIRQLRGEPATDAITCVPCGHSRRPDCFGKRLAQGVAGLLGLPFLQVFADRSCEGVSHPKEFKKLPPLHQIADPLPSMIIIDDLAVSGWHIEESMLAFAGLASQRRRWRGSRGRSHEGWDRREPEAHRSRGGRGLRCGTRRGDGRDHRRRKRPGSVGRGSGAVSRACRRGA
jgi:hypothetical protein